MSGGSVGAVTVQQLLDLERRIADQAEAVSKFAGSQPALSRMADELQARTHEHRRALEGADDELVEITPSASAQAPAARARAQTRLPRRRLRKSPPAGGGQVTGWWEQALT